jgi:hypothetical protein
MADESEEEEPWENGLDALMIESQDVSMDDSWNGSEGGHSDGIAGPRLQLVSTLQCVLLIKCRSWIHLVHPINPPCPPQDKAPQYPPATSILRIHQSPSRPMSTARGALAFLPSGSAVGYDIVLSDDSPSGEHPGTIAEVSSGGEDQLEWSEDEGPENIPESPRLDLVYAPGFNILSDLAAASESLKELNPQPVDVDRWE